MDSLKTVCQQRVDQSECSIQHNTVHITRWNILTEWIHSSCYPGPQRTGTSGVPSTFSLVLDNHLQHDKIHQTSTQLSILHNKSDMEVWEWDPGVKPLMRSGNETQEEALNEVWEWSQSDLYNIYGLTSDNNCDTISVQPRWYWSIPPQLGNLTTVVARGLRVWAIQNDTIICWQKLIKVPGPIELKIEIQNVHWTQACAI